MVWSSFLMTKSEQFGMAMGPVSFGQGDVSDNSVRRTGEGHLLDLLLALTEGEKLKPI